MLPPSSRVNLGSVFSPKDRDGIFLKTIGTHLPDMMQCHKPGDSMCNSCNSIQIRAHRLIDFESMDVIQSNLVRNDFRQTS
jgi:hypothetical protein